MRCQMVSPESIRIRSIIQTERVGLRSGGWETVHVITISGKRGHAFDRESEEGDMKRFGGRKRKDK